MQRMHASTAQSATAPASNPVPLKQDAAVIGLVGLAHATSHFSHLLLAPLFPVFMKDFGLCPGLMNSDTPIGGNHQSIDCDEHQTKNL